MCVVPRKSPPYYAQFVCWSRHSIFLRYRANRHAGGFVGAYPIWERVELEDRVWYHVTVLHIRHNLSAGTEALSLSVYEPIAKRVLSFPSFGGGVKLGGRVWCHVKILHIKQNLSAGSEVLSLSV